jgi:hypothetical protein
MLPDENAEALPIKAVRDPDSNRYVFGVELSGAFVPIAQVGLAYVDDLIARLGTPAEPAEPQPPAK